MALSLSFRFAKGFLPPLVLVLLVLLKRVMDRRAQLAQTFPFLRHEELLPALKQLVLLKLKMTKAAKSSPPSAGFLAQLHARQDSKLAGFFPVDEPTTVAFSLNSPLLARGVLRDLSSSGQVAPELKKAAAYEATIQHCLYQTRNWHRAPQLDDVAFAVKQALLPVVLQAMKKTSSKGEDSAVLLPACPSTWDTGLDSARANAVWAQSTSLAAWALYELGRQNTTKQQVEREMLANVGTRLPPSLQEASASSLPELDRFLCESRRLHTPHAVLVLRDVSQHLEVGDYVVPKRATLYVPLREAHRNEDFFVNAAEFDSQRYVQRPLERENLVECVDASVDAVAQAVARALVAYVVQQFEVTAAAGTAGMGEEEGGVSMPRFALAFAKREARRAL